MHESQLFTIELIDEVLKMDNDFLEVARTLHHHKSLIILGRGYNYATCLEGALVSFGIEQ
jgi:glucosamine--fructose-6-phosphate aminotransferase (isomerizing)